MSNNVNVVVLGGHLTRDVDLRFSDDGYAFASIGMCVNNRSKTAAGEWVDEPCFVDVKLSGKRAEAFAKYHSKGSACLFPRAALRFESWQDKTTGQNRSKLVVKAQDWEFVGEKQIAPVAGNTGGYDEGGGSDTPF